MSPGISDDFKEQVRLQTDITDLVAEGIGLTATNGGRIFKGLCPFHEDHNPSLCVYPERQNWRCWVCNEGGDCFSWVMKFDRVSFPEALETLAKRAGLEMPRQKMTPEQHQVQNQKQSIFDVMSWAEHQFHQALLKSPAGRVARDYLAERGISPESIEAFRLGYHPNDWNWLLQRAQGRYRPEHLAAAGLAKRRENSNGYHDFFVNRVLFTICDTGGRPVAFGGRVLPGPGAADAVKYFNSPENPVFSKSKLLYGLDLARSEIARTGTAVVTEGYTDCIMAHQCGLRNVVATLGTALTETHAVALKRFARKVVLVYDGDGPGRDATERSLAKLLSQEIDLRICIPPAGLDPADILLQHGPESFLNRIETAPEAWEYKLRLIIERYGLGSIDGRDRILKEMLDLIAQIPRLTGTSREALMLAKLAERVGLPEETIRQHYRETKRQQQEKSRYRTESRRAPEATRPSSAAVQQPAKRSTGKQRTIERELLEIVFAAPEMMNLLAGQVTLEDFQDPGHRALWAVCEQLSQQGIAPSYEKVTSVTEEPELKRLAVWIDENTVQKEIAAKLFAETIQDEQGREVPQYLAIVLNNLRQARRAEEHHLAKSQRAMQLENSRNLDEHTIELLKQAERFNADRQTKKNIL